MHKCTDCFYFSNSTYLERIELRFSRHILTGNPSRIMLSCAHGKLDPSSHWCRCKFENKSKKFRHWTSRLCPVNHSASLATSTFWSHRKNTNGDQIRLTVGVLHPSKAKVIQDGYRFVTVCTHGDFIVLSNRSPGHHHDNLISHSVTLC